MIGHVSRIQSGRRAAIHWIAVIVLAACRSAPAPVAEPDDGGGAFTDKAGFEPTAFHAEVTGEGRPIIFIPGLGCPGSVFDDTVKRLGDGYQAHVLTLAGFAGRPAIKKPLSGEVRKELTRYIKSRRLDHPIIVGHSMGGFVAYWLAERHPDLVGPVVIVDAGPALSDTDEDTGKRLRDIWIKASEEEFDANMRGVFSTMVNDPKHIAPFLDTIAKSNQHAMGDAIYELVTTDLRDKIVAIKSPVLVVLADGMFADRIRAQVQTIPDRTIKLMKGAKHFVFLDDPAGFAKILKEFLAEHLAGAGG